MLTITINSAMVTRLPCSMTAILLSKSPKTGALRMLFDLQEQVVLDKNLTALLCRMTVISPFTMSTPHGPAILIIGEFRLIVWSYTDRNLVIYDKNNQAIWASNTEV
jgi:hypothetical protein